jgi:hypothetical protein
MRRPNRTPLISIFMPLLMPIDFSEGTGAVRKCFFRKKDCPWKSPQDDLADAEKLINDCGFHRGDEEIVDATHAMLAEC